MENTAIESVKKEKVDKKSLKYQRDKDREIVRGVFRFYELPGGKMDFVLKLYKEDPVERYEMVDGQIYSIPLGVAKHLNKNGWYPVHKYIEQENGKHAMKIGSKVRRYGFQSLEFIDTDDISEIGKPIITVEYAG